MFLEFLLSLTPLDYAYLAKVVEVETVKNTSDEYCVAVSVLNRVRSQSFPHSVREVIFNKSRGKHHYQGFDYWNPLPDPAIVDRLSSEKGRVNLLKAYSIIGDRTDFKGQSQLRFRVKSEDPMCHPKGNFYHYYWQK